MNLKLIDTHAHLTCNALYERVDEIIQNAKDKGFVKILVVCTTLEEFERAKKVQMQESMIDIALGFHPLDLDKFTPHEMLQLVQALENKEIIALGEIGLDYHYEPFNKEKQKEWFIQQIELANRFQVPILIHMRDATKDTMDILQLHAKTNVLMHCFSGSVETAKQLLAMGAYLSFAGPLTFKNAKNLQEVAKMVTLNRVFVESDCPYLAPHPLRGKQNESAFVAYTFEKLCELNNVDPIEMADQMYRNYNYFFHQ